MKKNQISLILATFAFAIAFTSCKKDVESVKLNQTTAELTVGQSIQLSATVEPGKAKDKNVTWSSDKPYIVSVDENGSITAHRGGSATITATSNSGAKTASCAVSVDLIVESKFRTDSIWKVERIDSANNIQQTWSDVVIAKGCQKDTFLGEFGKDGFVTNEDIYLADCRKHPNGSGDMFSFEAVKLYKDKICPEGWRVPTREDFTNLDKALGGNGARSEGDSILISKYFDTWGAEQYYCLNDGYMGYSLSKYWSQTEFGESHGRSLDILPVDQLNIQPVQKKHVDPAYNSYKSVGYPVRCVK